MKIGIVADKFKDKSFKLLNYCTAFLERLGAEVFYPDTRDKYGDISLQKPFTSWEGLDLVISIGGDGTFLYVCHKVYPLDIPVIGVNLGRMGFMTEVEEEDLDEALTKIFQKDFNVKSRMMLEVKVFNRDGELILEDYAVNDAVLFRGSIAQIIPCMVSINGDLIETIPCDGLIVAAPTGSTGYALSCGGPIIDPSLNMLLVTPISPHTLHNRSYVLGHDATIQIRILDDYRHEPLFSVDGRANISVDSSVLVQVKRAKKDLKILSTEDINFFRRVPAKLNARGVFHSHG